jgi:hypothetical protein
MGCRGTHSGNYYVIALLVVDEFPLGRSEIAQIPTRLICQGILFVYNIINY